MWPNPQFPVDLVTFTEEILNGKLNFLYSVLKYDSFPFWWKNKQASRKPFRTEAAVRRCSSKYLLLKISQEKLTVKHLSVYLFNKVAGIFWF